MASSGKATSSWAAAAGVCTVEALRDKAGLCRWNHHAFRSSVQQRAGGGGSGSGSGGGGAQARATVPSACGAAAVARRKAKQQEEELRTVMYLSTWGPNN
ncbi:hypothetical protein ACP4OV_026191 [Aristida adscensionis]